MVSLGLAHSPFIIRRTFALRLAPSPLTSHASPSPCSMLHAPYRVTLPVHENEPARSVQRWCYRHSHYHHGFGVEGAARSDAGFSGADVADLFCLCPELHHHRYLLGQSSPSHSSRDHGRFGHSLGKH